jgi:hypothetical protein
MAVIVGIAAGFLSWRSKGSVPQAFLTGGMAFGGTVLLLISVAGWVVS